MNEKIIENWNKTIKPNDIVYHLGDFTFGSWKHIEPLSKRLNGRKHLILGNHDYKAKNFVDHFENVMSFQEIKNLRVPVVLCHFPLHESAFNYRIGDKGLCIHGHMHEKKMPDSRWVNVCVENINYTPIHIEDAISRAGV